MTVTHASTRTSASRSSASQPIEMNADRNYHLVLDNDRVRVFSVEVPAHQSTDLDIHPHDYVILSLGKSNFQVSQGSQLYPMPMEDGEMQVMKGGWPNRVTNLADMPLHLVEVEIAGDIHPEHPVCGLAAHECVDGKFGGSDQGTFAHATLFETDTVRLSRMQLSPGGVQPEEHYDRNHLLIALNDLQLSDESASGQAIHLKAGEAQWYPAATHQLKNLDHAEARLITIDLK